MAAYPQNGFSSFLTLISKLRAFYHPWSWARKAMNQLLILWRSPIRQQELRAFGTHLPHYHPGQLPKGVLGQRCGLQSISKANSVTNRVSNFLHPALSSHTANRQTCLGCRIPVKTHPSFGGAGKCHPGKPKEVKRPCTEMQKMHNSGRAGRYM